MRKTLTEWGGKFIVFGIELGGASLVLFILVALARLLCEVGKSAWHWGGLL